MPLGTAQDLMVGETVVAIGNPFGFSHTVTTGVVSATGRSLKTEGKTYLDFIQTDASINPGNSGGPLLNIKGELIGINTAIYAGGQNIGFAIPASKASRVTNDLIRFGGVRRGDLGLHVQDLTPELANALDARGKHGVVVREVEPGSPAASAGVQSGDVLVSIDGHEVKDRGEFDARVSSLSQNDDVRLGLVRRGESLFLTATVGALTDKKMEDRGWRLLGLRVVEERGGDALAVSDVRRGSAASRAGIRPGDRLVAVEGSGVDSLEAYRQALRGLHAGERAEIVVQRGRNQYRLALPVED
jgi:S1-C subfamily serine protease